MIKINRSILFVIFYSLITFCGEIGQIIWLPLWLDSTDDSIKKDGDPHYIPQGTGTYSIVLISSIAQLILFYILYLIFGKSKNYYFGKTFMFSCLINAVGGFFTPYVSSSYRTPPLLQAILLNACVPITVTLRFLWLKKLPTKKKGICVFVVIVALVVALIPEFLPKHDEHNSLSILFTGNNPIISFIWMLGFLTFQVFIGILVNLSVEKILKTPARNLTPDSSLIDLLAIERETNLAASLLDADADTNGDVDANGDADAIESPDINSTPDVFYVCLVMGMIQLIGAFVFSGMDLIPSFGYSPDIYQFVKNIKHTSLCTIGRDGCSYQATGFAIGFILSFVAGFIGGFSLILYGEGSTFWSLVENLVTPSAILFWILFLADPLRWSPHFDKMKWFSIVSLIIMFPALIIYNLGELEHTYRWIPSSIHVFGYNLNKIEIIR